MRNVLIVVAHPDDESLGAGATIKRFVQNGDKVAVMVLVGMARARSIRPDDGTMIEDQTKAMKILGVSQVFNKDFPNNKLNTVPQLHLVQAIESVIGIFKPDIIITHHRNDLNNDHYIVSEACHVASKMPLRTQSDKLVKEVWSMEVLSSTDWTIYGSKFSPNLYVPVSREDLDVKYKAVDTYYGVTRPVPHSRNMETVKALARIRGAECGVEFAEAYEVLYQVRSIGK